MTEAITSLMYAHPALFFALISSILFLIITGLVAIFSKPFDKERFLWKEEVKAWESKLKK